jgi:hypothetical protein
MYSGPVKLVRSSRVQPQATNYLIVPTKSRKGHPDVRPGYSHSGYIRFDETKKGISENWDVVQIPGILGILVHRVCLKRGHSTTRRYVRSARRVKNRPYLPWVVECTSAPYSTSTVSFCEETSLQNSFSTLSSETTRSFPILVLIESSSAWSPGGWAVNHIRRNSLSRA